MKRFLILATIWALSISPLEAQTLALPKDDRPLAASVGPAEPTASVTSLFGGLARDLRRLPSLDTAILLGVAGAASVAIGNHDQRITARLAASPTLDRVFEPGEMAGSGVVQVSAAVATYAVGRFMKSPKGTAVGADLVRAQLLNAALTQGIKLSVGRARPDGGRYSFPSGHSSSSFALASVLERHLGWKAAVPAYTLAAYVAASRLQENRHFASDIVFGAAVGIVAGRTVTIGRGSARFVLSPLASAGGAGAAVTWLGRP